MEKHKEQHLEEGDNRDIHTPRSPPKIEFPDPPNIENILGGIFPFKRSTRKKKEISREETPSNYSSSLGSPRADASSTDKESSGVDVPVQESKRTDSPYTESKKVKDFSPPKKKQYSDQTKPSSDPFVNPLTKKQYSSHKTPPTERPKTPLKQKQYSDKTAITTERFKTHSNQKQYPDLTKSNTEPSEAPQSKQLYSSHTTPSHSPKAISTENSSSNQDVHQAPSIPFIWSKESSSPHVYDLSATKIVTMDPGPLIMSGFHFSPCDVAQAVQCAQVQGIVNGNSRRLRPPSNVIVSRSWLVDAILQARQQKQQQ